MRLWYYGDAFLIGARGPATGQFVGIYAIGGDGPGAEVAWHPDTVRLDEVDQAHYSEHGGEG